MHRLTGTLVVAALCCGCSSCARPIPPTVTPRAATVTGASGAGLVMRLELSIDNPNDRELVLRSVRAHVTASGSDLGTVERAEAVRLPAASSTPFVTDVVVPWGGLPSLALGALFSPTIPYQVDGEVTVAGPAGIGVVVPFAMDGSLPRTMLLGAPRTR